MDQLASLGVEFDQDTITLIFNRLVRYYRAAASDAGAALGLANHDDSEDVLARLYVAKYPPRRASSTLQQWATEPIYDNNRPVRPWAFGEICFTDDFATRVSYVTRSPGQYRKLDPVTAEPTETYLENTCERVHSSVRVRLVLGGLGLNDQEIWNAPALKGNWRLTQVPRIV